WSFASIDDGKEGARLRRVGDEVGTHTVQAMGWDRVWLTEGSKRCQMKLGEQGTASPPKTATPAPRRGSNRFALKPELAAKITKVSDDEYNIERSLVDELLQDQASLMRSARVAPNKDGGGVRLSRIRPGTLLDHLGLKTGDTLQTINGFDLSDPQKALEAYGRLRTASNLEVSVVRGGSPKTIRFNIQ
ncbi:MAG: general secretion pathway protein GspC, partial [Myxococcales bacterium]|nr:general secretion pathway protein GspC [Myxococcales bacterium]